MAQFRRDINSDESPAEPARMRFSAPTGVVKYPMTVSPTGSHSCRIETRDRDNPAIGCSLDLPGTSVQEFSSAYVEWLNRCQAALQREAAVRAQRQGTTQPATPIAQPSYVADEPAQLAKLKEDGVLSEEEFTAEKAKLLS
jgi:hypothetical protein